MWTMKNRDQAKLLVSILAVVTAAALLLAGSVFGFAFEGQTALSGEIGSYTIAVDGEYYLSADATGRIVVNEGVNAILDLNGYKLTGSGSANVIENNGTLTIIDSNASASHSYQIQAGTSVTVYGGMITGGYGTNGGGIYNKGTLTVKGGNVIGNFAMYGAGIYNDGTMSLLGGKIIYNEAGSFGSGVFSKGTVTLGGKVKIEDNDSTNLLLYKGATVTFASGSNAPLTDGSEKMMIGLTVMNAQGDTVTGAFTDATAVAALEECFFSDVEDTYSIVYDDSVKKLELKSGHIHNGITFTEWTQTGTLPSTSGSYYLTKDVTLTGSWSTAKTINLDLNGHKISLQSGKTGSVIKVTGGELNIYDCDTKTPHYFTINTSSSSTTNGVKGAWKPSSTATDTVLYGGVITGGKVTSTGGAGLYITGGTVRLYGGHIAGNYCAASASFDGGGVYISNAKFYMYGGSITGNSIYSSGSAKTGEGGGIAIKSGGSAYLYGGSITDNVVTHHGAGVYADGGPVTVGGTIRIRGNKSTYSDYSKDAENNIMTSTTNSAKYVKVDSPKDGMDVGVRRKSTSAAISTDVDDYSRYFVSDNAGLYIIYDSKNREIKLGEVGTGMYLITVSSSEGGSVFANPQASAKDATITLTPSPKEGYHLETLTVKSGTTTIQTSKQSDGTYTFTMPSAAVTVTAVFEYGENLQQVSAPAANTELVYDGNEKTGVPEGTGYTLTNYKATAAGTYTAVATLAEGFVWSDGSDSAKNIEWSIAKATVNAPTVNSKVYTGDKLTAEVDVQDKPYTVTENNGGTNVGDYDVILTLSDPSNYKWSDSDIAAKTLTFSITKATNEWTTTPSIADVTYGTAITLNGEAKFGAISVSYAGVNGTSYESSEAPKKAGSYKATVTIAETADYSGLSKEISFSIAKLQLLAEGTEIEEMRVYDGTKDVTVTKTGSLTNAISGDKVTLSASAAFADANVGTDKAVVITYSLTGDDAENYIAPENKTDLKSSITLKQLEISGTTVAPTRVYDGTKAIEITNIGTLTNVVEGDTVTVNAVATYDNKNVGTGKAVEVVYTISGKGAANYAAPAKKTDLTAAITAKQLEATGTTIASSRVYDSTTDAEITNIGTLTNKFEGDEVTLSAAASYNNSEIGQDKAVTIVYTITGKDAGNYLAPVNKTDLTASITGMQLNATGTEIELSRVYDGTDEVEVTVVGTLENVKEGDEVYLSATAHFEDKNAGDNKKVTIVYSLSGKDAANYTAPANKTDLTATILPLQLTATGTMAELTRVYDGTKNAGLSAEGTLTNAVADDDVTLHATAEFDTKNAGTEKPITVVYTITGDDAANYITPVNKTDLKAAVTKKQLEATGTTVKASRAYDSTTDVEVTNIGFLTNKVEGDKVTLSAKADYEDAAIGEDKAVTVVYSITGDDADNYLAPVNKTDLTASITSLQLNATGTEIELSRVYDGTKEAEVTVIGTLENVKEGDEVILTAIAYFEDKNAGENKKVTIVYTLTGKDAANYTAPANKTDLTATILPLQLTATGTMAQLTRVYDGTKNAALINEGTLTNAVSGDKVTLNASASFADKNVGSEKAVTVVYTITGDDAKNYIAPVNKTDLKAAVTAKQLTVTGTTVKASRDYDGTKNIEITKLGELAGVVNGDTVILNASASFADKEAGFAKPALVIYTISGKDAGNYVKPADNTKLCADITKQEVSEPKADGREFVYNGEVQTFAVEEGEFYSVSGNHRKEAGSYEVIIALKDPKNYQWSDGTINDRVYDFIIARGEGKVELNTETIHATYGEPIVLPVATSNFGKVLCDTKPEDLVDAGTYRVTYTLPGTGSYSGITLTLTVVIEKQEVEMPETGKKSEFIYNGKDQTYPVSESDLYTVSGNVRKNAGKYNAVVALNNQKNYKWADGDSEDLTFPFEIKKVSNAIHDFELESWKDADPANLPSATADFGEVRFIYANAADRIFNMESCPTKPGEYLVKAYVLGTDDYEGAEAELSFMIYQSVLSGGSQSETEAESKPSVMIETEKGFHPNLVLEIKVVVEENQIVEESSEAIVTYESLAEENEQVSGVYDLRLLLNGMEVQPSDIENGMIITAKMLIPEHLVGKTFRLLHVHSEDDITPIVLGDKPGVGTYIIDEEGYLVTEIDRFSEFVFFTQPEDEVCAFHWWLIGLLVLFIGAFLLCELVLKKRVYKMVACGAFTVATIVLACFGRCLLCTVFTIIDLAVIVAGLVYTLVRKDISDTGPKDQEGEDPEEKEEMPQECLE